MNLGLSFDWDPEKAARNLAKHRVTFGEAASVFADRLSLTVPDPRHSIGEERLALLRLSSRGRLLVVVHTEREDIIRIISARAATRRERRMYEEGTP